jgi:hypothetical protein
MAEKFSLPADVIEALRHGNKIEAIKLLRAASKLGLAEAKSVIEGHDFVGHAARSHPHHAPSSAPRRDGLSPGEVPRSLFSPTAVVVALAVLALVVGYLLKAA